MAAATIISNHRCARAQCNKLLHCNYDSAESSCGTCQKLHGQRLILTYNHYNGEIRKCKFPNCPSLIEKSRGICDAHHGHVYFNRKLDPFFTAYGNLSSRKTSYVESIQYFHLPDLWYTRYQVFSNPSEFLGVFLCISGKVIVTIRAKNKPHKPEYILYEQKAPEIYHKCVYTRLDIKTQWLLVGGNVEFLRVSDSYIGILPKDIVVLINKFTWP